MIAVVASPSELDGLSALLPTTDRICRGAGWTYHFYSVKGAPIPGEIFPDLDGEPMVKVRYFTTVPEADAWVIEDYKSR